MSKLAAYTAARPLLLTGFLKAEINTNFTREDGFLAAGGDGPREAVIGMPAGRRLFGEPEGAVVAGGTGAGGIGAITLGPEVKKGEYMFTCIATAANGGRFQVVDPEGLRLPDLLVGVAYAPPQSGCPISAGDPACAVGAPRTSPVPPGAGKLGPPHSPAPAGSQRLAGFFARNTVAPEDQDAPTQIIRQMALIAEQAIVWPEDATDEQKAAVLAAARARFIEARPLA